jgi:hypothetical protein
MGAVEAPAAVDPKPAAGATAIGAVDDVEIGVNIDGGTCEAMAYG